MNKYINIIKKAAGDWSTDNCLRLGASVAYYTMTSLFPLLLVVVAVGSFILSSTTSGKNTRDRLITSVTQSISSKSSSSKSGDTQSAASFQQTLADGLKNASDDTAKKGLLSSIIGFVVLLFTASGVFAELDAAFNIIWKVPSEAQGKGISGFVKAKSLSFGLVLGVAFLLLVSTILTSVLTTLAKSLPLGPLWAVVSQLVSLGVTTLIFALLFKFLPDTEVAWGDVWAGAIFTAILWTVGQVILSFYFSTVGGSNPAYGIIGGVLAFLLYIYYSSQILFFGGEFTYAYANLHGSLKPVPDRKQEAPISKPAAVMVSTAYTAGHLSRDQEVAALKTQRVAAAATGGIIGLIGGALIGGVGLVIGIGRGIKKVRGR
ncbi:MAG: YihY/virulence factor BrkB family protein [Herpetosiphonaceae bacterium]|nr:YihY/virulence factor BrkB family protein [Herpetosiphonaceae bacterium]